MTQSLRSYSAMALARALKNLYPQHHEAVRSFSSYSHIKTWFQGWFKDSTPAGFNKQQPEKRPTRQNQQLQAEQKLQPLPYPGYAHRSSISSNSSIDWRKDPSGGSRESTDKIHAAKKNDAVGLKNKALEKTQKLCMSPNVSKQPSQVNHMSKSTSIGSKKPPGEIRSASKSNDLQGTRTPEKSQEPAQPPKQVIQLPHYEHKLQHLPHHGGVSSWRTSSNKCGIFCQCSDSLTVGVTKPQDNHVDTKKDLQADKTTKDMLGPEQSRNETTQQPHSEHKPQNLPHQGAVSDWCLCSDKCGMFCQWNESLADVFTKPKDEISISMKKNDLQGDKTPKVMLGPDKSTTETTQQLHSEHKVQHLPHHGTVNSSRTCSDKCELFCQRNDSLTGRITKPNDEIPVDTKNNNLQADKRKYMLGPDMSPSETDQQLHSEHKLQHLPHHGGASDWRTCSDKCGMFCHWDESVTSGMTKPKDEICVDTNNDLQADKKPKVTLRQDTSPSETTQQPHPEHKLQHLPHDGAASDWRTRSDKCGMFCQWNESLAGVFTKPKDEISISKKINDLHGDKTPKDMLQPDKFTTETTQQQHPEQKLQHLLHHGTVNSWCTCNDKCELFCQCNDSITGAITKPTDGIPVDTKNNDLQADKKKDMLGPDMSPSETNQKPHSEHKLQHLPQQGSVSDWRTFSNKCGVFCQWNESLADVFTKPKDEISISMKKNDLQGDKTPKVMLGPDKSTTETTHQPLPDYELQHLPHQGAVSDWQTCSDKCGMFCQWNDSLTGGMAKPTDKIRAARKSEDPGENRALENSQQQAKPLREVEHQKQNDHNIQHLPHHEAVCSWPTCNDKKGLSCKRNASFSESNKAPDDILVDVCSDDLEGDRATEKTKESAPSQTKQSSPTGDVSNVSSHSTSRSPPNPSPSDSKLQRPRAFDDWDPPPNEWRIKLHAMNMEAKSADKASDKKLQPLRTSSQLTQTPKNQLANEPYSGELVTQFPNYVHMRLRTRGEMWNLTRRSTSTSTLRSRHSYGGWDQPPNKLPITPYVNKSGSKPGGKSPDKPGAKAPEKPGAKAPEKPGAKAPEKSGAKAPEKSGAKAPEKPGTKPPEKSKRRTRRFSKHVEMLLDRTSIGKRLKEHAKKKDSKTKGEETSKSGSLPGKGGKK